MQLIIRNLNLICVQSWTYPYNNGKNGLFKHSDYLCGCLLKFHPPPRCICFVVFPTEQNDYFNSGQGSYL